MIYPYRCPICEKDFEIEMKMSEYDQKKDNQYCPKCSVKLYRILSAPTMIQGGGEGWFGKSNGSSTLQ